MKTKKTIMKTNSKYNTTQQEKICITNYAFLDANEPFRFVYPKALGGNFEGDFLVVGNSSSHGIIEKEIFISEKILELVPKKSVSTKKKVYTLGQMLPKYENFLKRYIFFLD